jgi:hypothetical protein
MFIFGRLYQMSNSIFEDFPKKIILKDSSECEFRIASGNERDDLIDFFQRVSPDDLWAMKRDYTRIESVILFLRSITPLEHICIFAYQGGRIIGMGSLYFSGFGARKEIGEVEIIVDDTSKQKRLGTWLMLEINGIASSLQLELLRIELMAGKDDAVINATKRANFIPQAVLKNYLKDREGESVDLFILVREIHEEWSDY